MRALFLCDGRFSQPGTKASGEMHPKTNAALLCHALTNGLLKQVRRLLGSGLAIPISPSVFPYMEIRHHPMAGHGRVQHDAVVTLLFLDGVVWRQGVWQPASPGSPCRIARSLNLEIAIDD